MTTKQVLIVGRTRMGTTGRVCVGALTEDGESIRLMDANCYSAFEVQSKYQLGDKWLITYQPCGEHIPPHVEDMAVSDSKKVGTSQNIEADVGALVNIWNGDMAALFDGCLSFTGSGSAYVDSSAIPAVATGFWKSTKDLNMEEDGNKIHYVSSGGYRRLKYVGYQEPVAIIPAGTLIRVSLARWWTPDPDFPERCYGQLSGWY